MTLLDSASYPNVRAALRSDVGSTLAPDAVLDFYAPQANHDVEVIVPGAGELGPGDDYDACVLAATYFCAARIALAIPSVTSQTAGPLKLVIAETDWIARASALRQEAYDALLDIPGVSDPDTMPTMFTSAPGGRGR